MDESSFGILPIFWWELKICGFLDWTGNGSWLAVRNGCHILQNILISEVMEVSNLLNHHENIHVSTDDTTAQARHRQGHRNDHKLWMHG